METIVVDGVALEMCQIAAPAHAPRRAPLVFLHEGLGSVAMWGNWPKALCAATGRDGWVYSRRGYGKSDPVADVRGAPREIDGKRAGRLLPDYMQHEAWDVLPKLLTQLRLSRPVLVGHSDGGSIALLHAARHPVSACVVMAPHVMVEELSIRSIEQARQAFEDGDLRQRLARYHSDVDNAFWQWNDAWLNPAFRNFDIRDDCRRISAPVLALQGIDDPYGTRAQIDDIDLPAQQITRTMLARCGHSAHRDQAAQTTQAIRVFLTALP